MPKPFHLLFTTTLFIAFAFALTSCGGSVEKTPIKVGDQIITETSNSQTQAAVSQFLQDKKNEVATLADQFSANFPGKFSVDVSQTHNINGEPVPTLTHNGQSLHFNHKIPDTFTAQTRAIATIFVRTGNDFVRIATSLKREDGGRAFGTTLDHMHPAYQSVLGGHDYVGTASLFGIEYMTQYSPIKDAGGGVIGISFVGIDISGDILDFKVKYRS